MKDKVLNYLISMEELREFVKSVLTPEMIIKNWVIEGKENPNLRLWILREMLNLTEKEMAEILKIPEKKYKTYEKKGTEIPEKIFRKISRKFGVSSSWLKCKSYKWFPEIKNLGN